MTTQTRKRFAPQNRDYSFSIIQKKNRCVLRNVKQGFKSAALGVVKQPSFEPQLCTLAHAQSLGLLFAG
jgi:hypothetical protein